MPMVRTEVHHHEHNVRAVCRRLAVAEKLRIIHRMKVQTLVTLERPILPPNPIHPCNKVLQALRLLQIPGADLVLFGVEIFLTAFETWAMLAEFEGRAIDAIGGAQGSRQYEAYEKGRSASVLEILGENVRRVGPQVGAEILTDVGLREFGKIPCDLLLR